MKRNRKNLLVLGIAFIFTFAVWTFLIQNLDVNNCGQNGTSIGFATLNNWFLKLTGVHMTLYTVTDLLGLIPVFVCTVFGGIGFTQMIKRKSLLKVDYDILLLGIYYIIVILCYLIFEMIPINYRPIPIDGRMEASYPSSTTLLVLSVMPTLNFQIKRRLKNNTSAVKCITVLSSLFSFFTLIGRLICGVHWLTDILGGILLSCGLVCIYRGTVFIFDENRKKI